MISNPTHFARIDRREGVEENEEINGEGAEGKREKELKRESQWTMDPEKREEY